MEDHDLDLTGAGDGMDVAEPSAAAIAEHFAQPDAKTIIEVHHGGLTQITVDSRRDVLVVMLDDLLEAGQKAAVRAQIQSQFGIRKVLILDGGWKMGVIKIDGLDDEAEGDGS